MLRDRKFLIHDVKVSFFILGFNRMSSKEVISRQSSTHTCISRVSNKHLFAFFSKVRQNSPKNRG